jgi:integrase
MELSSLSPSLLPSAPGTTSELPGTLLRLFEGVERSLTSANSRRAYRTALLHFFSWCSAPGENRMLSRLSVLQYKDTLIAAGRLDGSGQFQRHYAPATVNLRLAALRCLAQEAADQGLLSPAEAASLQRIRGEKITGSKIGNWLRKSQVDVILNSVDRSSTRGKRDYAILAVLFATALRRRELVELQISTIQQRDDQWGFIDLRGKGGKIRNISLPEWVRLAIMDWLVATQIIQGPVFRSITRHGKLGSSQMSEESVKLILSYYATLCGHEAFRPHDARRTCARLCRDGNAAIEDIQELLGHSSIQTTERYLGKTEGFKKAITNLIDAPRHTV